MASVSISIPDEIHDEVLEYAEKHTESVDQAYVKYLGDKPRHKISDLVGTSNKV
ncbi:hypothetical protein ACEU6E_00205 [Halorutilales archaeon Cl-col2-1]